MSIIRRRLLDDTIKKKISGKSFVVKSVARKISGLKIFGKSIQLTTTGAQLLKPIDNFPQTKDGVIMSKNNDGSYHLQGTATAEGNFRIIDPDIKKYPLNLIEATISLSAKNGSYDGSCVVASVNENDSDDWNYIITADTTNIQTWSVISNKLGCFLTYKNGSTYNVDIYPMLNSGNTALLWEPYTGGKPSPSPEYPQDIINIGSDGQIEITVSGSESDPMQMLVLYTPNGLPGIPVSSDGNYTDEYGQQWVCDEIDLARGKYVKRVAIEQKNGNFQMTESADFSGRYYQYSVLGTIFKNGLYESFCNIASWASWGMDNTHTSTNWLFALNSNDFYISPPSENGIESAEELNNFLNSLEFPVVFVGQLETPIETDLTAEEIAAYQELHTYSPTTTIINSIGAGMELSYKTRKSLEVSQ